MMLLYRTIVSALLVMVPPISNLAATPLFAADIASGERLAVRWCASCHLVKPEQTQAMADAPSFLSIALRPDFSVGTTATFLMAPHPRMPSYSLSRLEAQAIASYIESLAKPAR